MSFADAGARQGFHIGGDAFGIGQGHECARWHPWQLCGIIAAPMAAAGFAARQRAAVTSLAAAVMLSSAGSVLVRFQPLDHVQRIAQAFLIALQRRHGGSSRHAAHAAARVRQNAPAPAERRASHPRRVDRAHHRPRAPRTPALPATNWRPAGWRHASPVEAHSPTTHRPGRDVRPCTSAGDAAHVIMRRRRHRNRLHRRIDARRDAGGVDGRETMRRIPRRWLRGNPG